MNKMDLLLIYPPISINERYGKDVGDVGGNMPPLGITQIASYLREKEIEVGLIDAVIENYTLEELIKKTLDLNPKVIGLSALTSNFYRTVIFARKIKKERPDTLIILGGQHASIMLGEILKEHPYFDLLVYGEGELTAEELVRKYKESSYNLKQFLENYETLSNIKGIVFRKREEVIISQKRELITNLDELPLPAWDLLPMEKYIPLPNQYKRTPVINMVVIRGCPFSCSFCSANVIALRRIRPTSPERVVQIIEHVIQNYGIKEISFWDDMLTTNKEWLHRLCNLIIQKKIDIVWSCYSRVDRVDYELLKHMKEAGCWNIFFGYESGNQQLLNNINKGITLEQIEKANELCKKVGIEIRASFMLALPGETPELAEETIKFAKKLNPDYAQFCITTPYPGTKLYEEAEKYGSLSKNFSEYHGWKAVFVPFGYKSSKEIEELEKRATREFYLRPRYILSRM
ncbi:cobalamin B12-binding domain-containing protein, partial [Candidatus Woesearchaeota archaeon]|nr:cobalamin B12-binding domain-containing protein [Candidatus Woesearchaeota archaeon]